MFADGSSPVAQTATAASDIHYLAGEVFVVVVLLALVVLLAVRVRA